MASVKKRNKLQRFFFLCLSILIIGSLIVVWQKHILSIQHIECSVDGNECPENIRQTLAQLNNSSIFFTRFDKITETVSQLDHSFQLISIEKKLPNSVKFIFHQVPELYGVQEEGKAVLLVNNSGNITRSSDTTELDIVKVPSQIYDQLKVGQPIEAQFHQNTVELLDLLKLQSISYTSLSFLSKDDVELILKDGKKVELTSSEVSSEVPKLGYVLKSVDFSSFKEPIKTIDVRFKYPVLKS
jgi:cell division septal protein FtsQ